jgi:hypothetical protein
VIANSSHKRIYTEALSHAQLTKSTQIIEQLYESFICCIVLLVGGS